MGVTQAADIAGRLDATWSRWWLCSLGAGLAGAAALAFGALGVAVLLDAAFRLPQPALGAALALWAALSAAALGVQIARLLRFRRSREATARRVEREFPELGSHLINVVQLSGADEADPFRAAAVAQAVAAIGATPFERAAERRSRRERFGLCMQTPRDVGEATAALAGVLVLGGLCSLVVPGWGVATRRVLHPWAFVPASGSVRVLKVAPGDTEVLLGSALDVSAEVDDAGGRASRSAWLFVRPDGGRESRVPMRADASGRRFAASVPQLVGPVAYRLEIGDTQTRRYAVGVYRRPTVAAVAVTYEFPAYLDRPSRTVRQAHGDLQAPAGTRAMLAITPAGRVVGGEVRIDGRRESGRLSADGRTLAVELLLTASTTYTIDLVAPGGHRDESPRANRISVEPDAPPTVALVEPSASRDARVVAGGALAVAVRAGDDHGLGEVRIERKPAEPPDAPASVVARWSRFDPPTAAVLSHSLAFDASAFPAGGAAMIRAVARDRRSLARPGLKREPQEAATPWVRLNVIPPEAQAEADRSRLDRVRTAVAALLREQLAVRAATAGLPRSATDAAARSAAEDVRARQVAIQKAATELVATLADAGAGGAAGDDEVVTARRVVNKLAYGDMIGAVEAAEVVARIESRGDLPSPVGALSATQDRIIDVLRRLMNEVRRAADALLAEAKTRPDTTLPPDVQEKLRSLRDKLREFLAGQKKVIEATEALAKKPVDDFSEEDAKALDGLAATEDDWSKFLADRHSDLSKLPEQDFSNPALLEELIAVQTQITMAKDALTKKAADIAVPLEQLGAEMAAEMTTNIEKWLPDSPDREKWSQEEPLTDDMKEAPLAELPKELEDLVGELMEEEEDLFDEMEDVSSSWADSIDKGAGWDAMDGPISNNSARGVTGNRLPNTNEIAGRSGEGRSGKASGEFVSGEAVGKGGRKTPSRLTPDAFVKGRVKDTSKDPVGGATGGGKESGVGGEGLQGPVPERARATLARLADRQASLRNRAEGVNLKFEVMKYHPADLKAMIRQMASVEGDLRAGRYRNAMRQRPTLLEGLDRVRGTLAGEAMVRRDETANLPAEIQKEILGTMQEASPAGWEALNRRYFERLAAPAGAR
jgi:hypothetical protein